MRAAPCPPPVISPACAISTPAPPVLRLAGRAHKRLKRLSQSASATFPAAACFLWLPTQAAQSAQPIARASFSQRRPRSSPRIGLLSGATQGSTERMHQAASLQFERMMDEFVLWHAVPEDERSPAPAWWWGPAMAVFDAQSRCDRPGVVSSASATARALPKEHMSLSRSSPNKPRYPGRMIFHARRRSEKRTSASCTRSRQTTALFNRSAAASVAAWSGSGWSGGA